MVDVVVLIPWRGGDEVREYTYRVARPYIDRLGYRVFEGDREGPWSRAAAINAASEAAGDWDVAIICDADTIPSESTKVAVGMVHDENRAIRPHDHLYRVSMSGVFAIERGGIEALQDRHIEAEYPGGGQMVISRKAWDSAGPFSEEFVGWGHEDSYQNIMFVVHADWDRIAGSAYHLWHPDSTRKTREYMQNRQLLHRARVRYENQIHAATMAKGFDVGAVL